jgi:hypothetical protein
MSGYGLTGAYSCVVIVFGMGYKKLAAFQTIKENWRYQKQYEDALISRLFIFNSINYYMPMLLVAFMVKSYDNLFMMMATQMAGKQILMNLLEYLIPILKVKKNLTALNEKYNVIQGKFST